MLIALQYWKEILGGLLIVALLTVGGYSYTLQLKNKNLSQTVEAQKADIAQRDADINKLKITLDLQAKQASDYSKLITDLSSVKSKVNQIYSQNIQSIEDTPSPTITNTKPLVMIPAGKVIIPTLK